jgi:anti-anti-sigma factor
MADLDRQAPLEVRVVDTAAGPVIKVAGELDLSNAEILRRVIDAQVASDPGRLLFDLAGVTFLDTSGIALLLKTSKRVPSLKVLDPSVVVRRIIEVTGLAGVLVTDP